jgi:hypothetical protein
MKKIENQLRKWERVYLNVLKMPGTTRKYQGNLEHLLDQAFFTELLSLQTKFYYSKKRSQFPNSLD